MKKKDLIIVFLLVAVAACALLVFSLDRNDQVAERTMQVFLDGKLYSQTPLRTGERVTIEQPDGSKNVILMTENGFQMESSTCRDQLCVDQGQVTMENWKGRKLGNQVICLPNRVVVELKLSDVHPGATADPFVPDV